MEDDVSRGCRNQLTLKNLLAGGMGLSSGAVSPAFSVFSKSLKEGKRECGKWDFSGIERGFETNKK